MLPKVAVTSGNTQSWRSERLAGSSQLAMLLRARYLVDAKSHPHGRGAGAQEGVSR